jgi:hypothetical protein
MGDTLKRLLLFNWESFSALGAETDNEETWPSACESLAHTHLIRPEGVDAGTLVMVRPTL